MRFTGWNLKVWSCLTRETGCTRRERWRLSMQKEKFFYSRRAKQRLGSAATPEMDGERCSICLYPRGWAKRHWQSIYHFLSPLSMSDYSDTLRKETVPE